MLAQLPTAALEPSDRGSGTGALSGEMVVWPNPPTGGARRWAGRTKSGTLMCAGMRQTRRDVGDKLVARNSSSGRSDVSP
jgi:hypothetical protein